MSHKSIRTLIEQAVRSVQDDVQYSYGKETDLNQTNVDRFMIVNTSPMVANSSFSVNSVSNYSKAWNVEMAFYMLDREDSIDYPNILDRTDAFIDSFITLLNLQESLTISAINQAPFIKAMANILTGHILTFTVTLNDDLDYCDGC